MPERVSSFKRDAGSSKSLPFSLPVEKNASVRVCVFRKVSSFFVELNSAKTCSASLDFSFSS